MVQQLTEGMDSLGVTDKVKRQLFVDAIGICAAPGCSTRLMQNRTNLGECAHIIPRRVGSHPREDWTTPLEDRRKEPNLLYLCEAHHKQVDDEQHADLYTAEALRQWKRDHEAWAASIRKDTSPVQQKVMDQLVQLGAQIAQQAAAAEANLNQLLDTCHDLLQRNRNNEARAFLAHIDTHLIDIDSPSLRARADILGAILLIRNEQIPEAKQSLLSTIQSYSTNVDAMLEYVELCEQAPEPGDEAERIESLVRGLAGDHPRLLIMDLRRKLNNREFVAVDDISADWTDDIRLNVLLMLQYALHCDATRHNAKRDALLDRWESDLPQSPRPHLFRVIFKVQDASRSEDIDAHTIREILGFLETEREQAETKDPIGTRDQITWALHQLRLGLELLHVSGSAGGIDIPQLRDTIVQLIRACYFDRYINDILPELLTNLRIEPGQWQAIVSRMQESNVVPSPFVMKCLLAQTLHIEALPNGTKEFFHTRGNENLLELREAFEAGDPQKAATVLNQENDLNFSLMVLEALPDHAFSADLLELLKVPSYLEDQLLYARLKLYAANRLDSQALDLLSTLENDLNIGALSIAAEIYRRNQLWDQFIPAALQMLTFDIPEAKRALLNADLGLAYFYAGDPTYSIDYAEQALNQCEILGETNSQILLQIIGQAYQQRGLQNQACEKFQEYNQITRDFALSLLEAELYLQSSLPDKHNQAVSLIVRAFEEAETCDDPKYLAAFLTLVELSNANAIPFDDEPAVTDNLFVKVDDMWFHVGSEGYAFDATRILPGTANYEAVEGKSVSDEVEWPADKYLIGSQRRKIVHIATDPSYLGWRAQEALERQASMGNASIWMIQVHGEAGNMDLSNMHRLMEEVFQQQHDMFDRYVGSPLPFSFLAKMEGGIGPALGRIATERRGFIRCNDGTLENITLQNANATSIVNGDPCVIGGLATLVLAEANLLETVIKAVPQLCVSTSVIKMLRSMSSEILPGSSVGRMALVDGNLEVYPSNQASETQYKDRLRASADLLDQLPRKLIGKTYQNTGDDLDLDSILPEYFVDTLRLSQEQDAHIITDDWLLLRVYENTGEDPIPPHTSSLSLIRALADSGHITWEAYLRYFGLLTRYRYHFLPISVDDMIRTVLSVNDGGLVIPTPKNLYLLNLSLTLSQEYGVNDDTVLQILTRFFVQLITDNTITPDIADSVFTLTITEGLAGKDKRIMAQSLSQLGRIALNKNITLSPLARKKLESLNNQLAGFAQGASLILHF
jgi:hypothetical protein